MASPLLLLLTTSLCFLSTTVTTTVVTAAAAADTLKQGESLAGAATLVSAPNGVFELGFFSPAGGNTSRQYVGIWYRGISPQTVAWVANRDAPATSPSASVTVTASGDMQVLDGGSVLWSTNTSAAAGGGGGNFTATLLDTGNLVLRIAGGGDGEPVWQSFDHPGDTMLSGMRIKVRTSPGISERMLFTSWKDAGDPASGRYALGLDPAGSGQAYIWRDGNTPIWRSGQWSGQNFVGIPWRPLYLYGFKQANDPNLGVYYTYTASNTSLQRFVVMPNGTDICYMVEETTREWETVWMQPSNGCEFYATCGANAKCIAGDDGKAMCSCLKGFEPNSTAEWKAGNWSRGCMRSHPLGCQVNQTGDGFLTISGIKLPDFSNWVSTVGDENGCRSTCLANCSCGAYVYMSAVGCMVWGQKLIDIYQFPQGGYNLFLKLPASELRSNRAIWKTAIIATAVVLFVLVVCIFVWWKRGRKIKDAVNSNWKAKQSSTRSQHSSGVMLDVPQSIPFDDEAEDGKGHELRVYSLDCIKTATCNFSDSNKLGAGGFGPVYKGKLPEGEEVAVKRLSRSSGQGLEEFKNEVILIAKLQHRNLVRLLGCCLQGEEKILVYEYMPNGSLDAFLFNPEKQGLLDWRTRFDIIEGIARGLLYLHRDSRLRIVHRDLKASNILLDTDMNPKISDFGMARNIFGGDQNQFNTNRVVGTFGYMSPEYAMEGIFSVKSDVYSFGILILEIITGKRGVSFHDKEDSLNIAGYAWRQWNEDKADELIDPLIRTSCPVRQVMRCVHIALLCVQAHAHDRPDIPLVILMLSSDSSILPSPKPPTFMLQHNPCESQKSREKDATYSVSDVSMTQLHGR